MSISLDAGASVYLYEFVHRPEMHNLTRPSFVKADHADDVGFMFGACFWNGHIKLIGRYQCKVAVNFNIMLCYCISLGIFHLHPLLRRRVAGLGTMVMTIARHNNC